MRSHRIVIRALPPLLLFSASGIADAQTIETFAGNGNAVQGLPPDNGPALTTPIANLQDVAIAPDGTVYFVDASRVRRVGLDGNIVTVPGTGPRFGPASNSANIAASDIAVSSTGRVFVTDGSRFRVLEMSPAFAFVPVAGTGAAGFSGDGGLAIAAQLSGATAIDVDAADNLYIADGNRIRRVSSAGIIATVAVSNFGGPPGQYPILNMAVSGNGTAYTYFQNPPTGLWKSTAAGDFVRVNPSASIIQRCVSTPVTTQAIFGPPRSGRDGLIYIANGTCVSRLTPGGLLVNIVGSPQGGFVGETGPASVARFQGINSLAFDAAGRLYIGDAGNYRIRRVTGLAPYANTPPLAASGPDQTVVQGDTVSLNGSASADPDGDTLQYAWTFTQQPSGSTAQLLSATVAQPQFTADKAGDYLIRLEVSDGQANASDDTTIHVQTVAEFALDALNATMQALALTPDSALDTPGHRNALNNDLGQATNDVVRGKWKQARQKIEKALARLDGCYLRGTPDGNGNGADWIVDCGYQTDPYFLLNSILVRMPQ